MNRIKLLLVEDDLIDQMSFKRSVKNKKLPYDYTIAGSIAQAREILRDNDSFDLIILDHALGDGTAFDLFEEIPKTIPVIFVTGAGNEEIAVKALKQGVSDYVVKDLHGDYLNNLLPLAIISAIKAKMIERKRFMQSQEIANVGTWEWNIKTDELYWSEQVFGLLGYKPGAIKASYENFIAAIHPDDIEMIEAKTHKSINENLEYNVQFRVIWPDKSVHWLQEKGAAIYDEDGKASLMLGITNDITKIKEVEIELRQARHEADSANKAKSEFLSSMSHELRTPLNSILGFSQLLLSDEDEPLTAEQRDNIDQIMQGGEHLLQLINDILDLAKIEAGKITLSLEVISVNNLLEESLSLIKPIIEKYKVQLYNHCDLTDEVLIYADYLRTKQVLLNLLSNAAKYNSKNGCIHINCCIKNDALLKIIVTDSGHGISKEKQQEVFKPFSRLEAENSHIEGTGIGLVICQKLIEKMQGKIGFESETGKGSSFWFELPLSKYKKAANDKKTNIKDPFYFSQIDASLLYIEDSPSNLKLIEILSSRIKGLSLIIVKNVKEAIKHCEEIQPDVIIMDTELSDNNGIKAVQQLKDNSLTQAIPIISTSTVEACKGINEDVNIDFEKHLTNSIDANQVLKKIYNALENKD